MPLAKYQRKLKSMIKEKDIFYYATVLSEQEDIDLEVAEMAVRGALDSHLDEDGTIDDFEELYEDAAAMARQFERDNSK